MAIKAPAFAKNAVPSLKGWHHPKTNELLKSTRHTQAQLDEFFGLILHDIMHDHPSPAPAVKNPATPPKPVTLSKSELGEMGWTVDQIMHDHPQPTPEDLAAMSKIELEELGREYGVELDRRLSKQKLLDQVATLVKR